MYFLLLGLLFFTGNQSHANDLYGNPPILDAQSASDQQKVEAHTLKLRAWQRSVGQQAEQEAHNTGFFLPC